MSCTPLLAALGCEDFSNCCTRNAGTITYGAIGALVVLGLVICGGCVCCIVYLRILLATDEGKKVKRPQSRGKLNKENVEKNVKQPQGRKKSANEAASYTVERFITDHLVPAEGFAFRMPSSPGRGGKDQEKAKELQDRRRKFWEEKIRDLNQKLQQALDQQTEGGKRGKVRREDHISRLKESIPFEAVCRVRLSQAKLKNESDKHRSFDFNAEACLPVVIYGELLFPPSATWNHPGENEPVQAKAARGEKMGIEDADSRFRLKIQIEAVLQRRESGAEEDAEGQAEDGGDQRNLEVKCRNLLIKDTDEEGGDAMIDSWLPKDEIKLDIEMMLDDKLASAVGGTDG